MPIRFVISLWTLFGYKLRSDILLIVPGFNVFNRKNTRSVFPFQYNISQCYLLEACNILLKYSFQVIVYNGNHEFDLNTSS
jgi:hypothetical protein